MKLADPWLKLAAASAADDRNDEALRYLSRALERADVDEARKPIVELASGFDAVLSGLLKRRPDDPQLQLAWARKLAERGRRRLAENQPARAQADLEESREMVTRLTVQARNWTVPAPIEMKTESGAGLELLRDGSVFAHQDHPGRFDTYSLVFASEWKGIKGLRLEALADSRLPGGGPGWAFNGNITLDELRLLAASARSPDEVRPIVLGNPSADFNQAGWDVRDAIDGNGNTGWGVHPEFHKDHMAVFELAEEVGDGQASRLTVQLEQGNFGIDGVFLGRFRMSFTNDAKTLQATRVRLELKDSEVAELDVALAKAHAQQGHTDEAVASFTSALPLAADRAGKARIIAEAAPLRGVLEKLAERAAGDGRFQSELARHYAERGNTPLADAARTRARVSFEEKLARDPENTALAMDLFSAYQLAGRTREAVPYLAKTSAANPSDFLLLQVAALQAWFGQEKELAATRQRILAFAKDTTDWNTAERSAKACSILPWTDKAELAAALALARKGVELGRGGEWWEWRLLALGMAEYRSGNHAAAIEALLGAARAGSNNPVVTGISAFYRAMSLSRQGKSDEARKIAIAAAAQMKPFPKDEQNPPTGDAYWDDLILWLAYKEAKAMIRFELLPAAADQSQAK